MPTKREVAWRIINGMKVGEWVNVKDLANQATNIHAFNAHSMSNFLKQAKKQGLVEHRYRNIWRGRVVTLSEWKKIAVKEN